MNQSNLKPAAGATHSRKRVGRGNGSGHGNYSGRGCKGHKARAGGGVRPGFEGGQLPLIKRLPRLRGFSNTYRVKYSIVNVGSLNKFAANSEVTPEELLKAGLIKSINQPVKILGEGKIDRLLIVKASKFSTAAASKISAAGGKTEAL
jgi:large subunit ribosomal protein L15